MNKSKLNFQWLMMWMIICSGIGGILYGYDVGVYSGALPFIRSDFNLSTNQLSVIGGAVFGGGLLGTIATGYLSDKFGRRTMIIISSVLFLLGIIWILVAKSFLTLLCARLTMGVGVGIVAVAVPSYLSEIAPAKIRGKSVAVFQLFLTIGILIAYMVDKFYTPTGNWHAMFMLITIPAVVLFITMLCLPESPRWLIANGKNTRALDVIHCTRSALEAELEIRGITESLNAKQSCWRDLFSRQLALPLFLTIFVVIFNQLTAINGFLQYAPEVFSQAGFASNGSAMEGAIALGAINLLGTLLALSLVDKLGRRTLLMFGTGGVVLSYIFLAIFTHIESAPIISLFGLVAFVFFFAIGPGVVVWLVISELFPTELRSKGVALGIFFSSLFGWIVTTSFLQIKDYLGLSGTYSLFAICTLIYFIVVAKWLPETKQKSLEQIQKELA
ncbi:MAG: sugar porter family MFS transporter [Gammaproteobacteria bacterium]|nr:sugar porter family MFS transporter [Gammaproteobacteria bacterium]